MRIATILFLICLSLAACSTRPATTPVNDTLVEQAYVEQRFNDVIAQLDQESESLLSAKSQYYLALSYIASENTEKYPKALSLLDSSANAGYADSAWELARIYDEGTVRSKDTLLALDWFRRHQQLAQEQNTNPPPQYFDSNGDPISPLQMLHKITALAENGDLDSKTQLAKLYSDGPLTAPDMAKSLKWYIDAAESGSDYAALMAGYYYCRGLGTDKNEALANEWLAQHDTNLKCH